MIRKLDSYLFFSFLAPFLLCMVMILGLTLVVETSERLGKLIRYDGQDSLLQLLGRYYVCRVPVLAYLVAPIITLSGAIVSLVWLARQNELMAMQASGISMKRIAVPLLTGGFIAAALAGCLQEVVVPGSAREMQRISIKMRLFGDRDENQVFKDVFAIDPGTSIWLSAREFDYSKKTIYNGELDFPPRDGKQTLPLRIDSGYYRNQRWHVTGREPIEGPAGVEHHEFVDRLLDVTFTPEDLVETAGITYRSLGELLNYAQHSPSRAPALYTEVHKRLAYPFMNVILLLLAIPLVVESSGQTSVRGIGLAVLAALGFYVVMMAMLDFGYRGYLPPVIAAWSAPVAFTGIGYWMYKHFRG